MAAAGATRGVRVGGRGAVARRAPARRARGRCCGAGGGAATVPVGSAADSEAQAAPRAQGAAKVVVLGGAGRIGASTCAALAAALAEGGGGQSPRVALTLASRDPAAAARAAGALRGQAGCSEVDTVAADVDDRASVIRAIQGADLVINCAGPFQCNVLEACIASRVPYLDVSDDAAFSARCREYGEAARAAGVPCVTSAGLYPGLSNLLAAHMKAEAEREAMENGVSAEEAAANAIPERLRFSYWTAGSGGAGRTILATSLLLLGEEVEAYEDGARLSLPPMSNSRVADFGPNIGKRRVYLLNLPEVGTAHRLLGARTVSARFCTSPIFWNWGMDLLAKVLPRSLLNDPEKCYELAGLLEPVVRFMDERVGEETAMRVDMDTVGGLKVSSVVCHPRLTESAGIATAAFARAILEGKAAPGVWYPEEEGCCPAGEDRKQLIEACVEGGRVIEVNVGQWTVASRETQLGMGLYYDPDMIL